MTTMDPTLMLVILVILALLAVAVLLQERKRVSHALDRVVPEYERIIDQLTGRLKAEAEPNTRQREKLCIKALSAADAARFHEMWKLLQARFVESPAGSLAAADRLVRELMQKRGYPMGHFERHAADISVDHPAVVDHYSAAREIALRDRRDAVNAEGMRQAVIHYRALFAELLEVDASIADAQSTSATTYTPKRLHIEPAAAQPRVARHHEV